MPRNLSATAIASQNAENTSEIWLVLLTIDHDLLAQPIRLVNNNEAITSNGNQYIACAFDVDLPGEDAEGPISARLRVDNVDRVIVNTIRSINSPPQITLQVVLASDPDVVEVEYTGLILRSTDFDQFVVSGELRFEDIVVEPIAETITPQHFRGLF